MREDNLNSFFSSGEQREDTQPEPAPLGSEPTSLDDTPEPVDSSASEVEDSPVSTPEPSDEVEGDSASIPESPSEVEDSPVSTPEPSNEVEYDEVEDDDDYRADHYVEPPADAVGSEPPNEAEYDPIFTPEPATEAEYGEVEADSIFTPEPVDDGANEVEEERKSRIWPLILGMILVAVLGVALILWLLGQGRNELAREYEDHGQPQIHSVQTTTQEYYSGDDARAAGVVSQTCESVTAEPEQDIRIVGVERIGIDDGGLRQLLRISDDEGRVTDQVWLWEDEEWVWAPCDNW